MKVYVIDNDEVVDNPDGSKSRISFSAIHYESSDFRNDKDLSPEETEWSPDKVILELQHGAKAITGIPIIELARDIHYPDGTSERLETISVAVDVAYALYKHFEEIDQRNPDNLMW